jgi:type VI secretion system protein VasD
MLRRYVVLAALLAAALPPLSAAGKETKLVSEVVAAATINPNRRGAPQPVKIHIFYLAHDEKFLQAAFGDLADPQSPFLGDELVRRAEQLVGPGETLKLDEKFDEATKFIGVVAEFTELEKASWRGIVAVPAKRWTEVMKLFKNSKLQVLVDGITVSCAIVED